MRRLVVLSFVVALALAGLVQSFTNGYDTGVSVIFLTVMIFAIYALHDQYHNRVEAKNREDQIVEKLHNEVDLLAKLLGQKTDMEDHRQDARDQYDIDRAEYDEKYGKDTE